MAGIAKTVLNEPRSGIRNIMELALTMEDVIHLEVGEPQFATPAHIVEAGRQALADGYTKYTPNAGMNELRAAVARSKSKQLGVELTAGNVLIGIGGVEVINAVFRVLCEAGDEILLPDPSWPNYKMMATISSTRAVPYHLLAENDFYPDMDELESLVTDKTRLLVVNSPSNPLGVVFPEKVMRELLDFAERHDLYLLSDEAYEQIVYDGEMVSPVSFDKSGRVIAAHTMSKTYAMTGWRIGYAIASEDVISAMTKVQEAYVSSVPGAFQMAAVAALEGPQDCVSEMRDEYKRHRDAVATILEKNNIKFYMPGGAFYMWINIGARRSQEFAESLLREKHVTVSPGSAFGSTGEGWIRISLASSLEDLETGMNRMVEFINGR